MKENKAFRILFITKKQLKSRQGSHRQKQSSRGVLYVLNISKIHRKTPVTESHKVAGLRAASLLKRDSGTGVFQ